MRDVLVEVVVGRFLLVFRDLDAGLLEVAAEIRLRARIEERVAVDVVGIIVEADDQRIGLDGPASVGGLLHVVDFAFLRDRDFLRAGGIHFVDGFARLRIHGGILGIEDGRFGGDEPFRKRFHTTAAAEAACSERAAAVALAALTLAASRTLTLAHGGTLTLSLTLCGRGGLCDRSQGERECDGTTEEITEFHVSNSL